MAESEDNSLGIKIFSRLGFFELVADVSSGVLMVFLFGSLLFATQSILRRDWRNSRCELDAKAPQGPRWVDDRIKPEDLYIPLAHFVAKVVGSRESSVAPKESNVATGESNGGAKESTVSPWFFFVIALVLGFLSRAVCVMYSFFTPKFLSRVLARRAHKQLLRWHGLPSSWDYPKILVTIIFQDPFHRIGGVDYARYRAALDDQTNPMSNSKPYWDYEAFLFVRSHHFYGLFISFFEMYLFYGILVIGLLFTRYGAMNWSNLEDWKPMLLWALLIVVSFLVTICLLQEMIIHGIAFLSLDGVLYKQFEQVERDRLHASIHTAVPNDTAGVRALDAARE